MKCYYRVGDESWLKGEIISLHGQIHFTSRNNDGTFANQITLDSPNVNFVHSHMVVSGFYRASGDHRWTFITVDVSGGWVRPK